MEEIKKTLKKELKDIEKKIKKLKKEKKDIEKQLIEISSDFKEKFQIWYSNGRKGHHSWAPSDEDEFPLVSKLLDECYLTRYKDYELIHLVGEEILGLFDSDDYREFYDSEEAYQAEMLKHQPLMEEIMKNNLKSFTNDW